MAKTTSHIKTKTTTPTNQKRVYYTHQDDLTGLPNLIGHQNESFQWLIDEGL
jgi:hypothetical protein